MGRLKPGASYVYELADGITYAREVGAPANERFEIGRSLKRKSLDEVQEWLEICEAAKTDPTLHAACERVKLLYYLSKEKCQNPSA